MPITSDDAHVINMYQVMRAFNCLDLNVYRNNPAWFNEAALALIRTETRAGKDERDAAQH